jgi:O-antigen/teichoic acid export membrane protein
VKRLGGTFGGALANLAAQGIPFLLVLVVTPILLRSLGREQYGALILFNLVPLIAGQLDLGLATAAMRGFTQYSARGDDAGARRLFREAFLFLMAWGALLGAALYLFHAPLADLLKLDTIVDAGSPIWWVSALAVPLALVNSATLVPLRALERYGRAARIQVSPIGSRVPNGLHMAGRCCSSSVSARRRWRSRRLPSSWHRANDRRQRPESITK